MATIAWCHHSLATFAVRVTNDSNKLLVLYLINYIISFVLKYLKIIVLMLKQPQQVHHVVMQSKKNNVFLK